MGLPVPFLQKVGQHCSTLPHRRQVFSVTFRALPPLPESNSRQSEETWRMARNIKGNQDGPGGGNNSYTIPGRGTVRRKKLVQEVEDGKHPNFGIYETQGEKYVRGKPDRTKGNNVNSE